MKPTALLQEIRKMRFGETFSIWTEGRITQEEAAHMLGVSSRSFRRYIDRYKENGIDGLIDKRLSQASARKALVDEVLALAERYQELDLDAAAPPAPRLQPRRAHDREDGSGRDRRPVGRHQPAARGVYQQDWWG